MTIKYSFAPIYINIKNGENGPNFSPQWIKWFTDANPLLATLSNGVSGTVTAGGHTLTFTNGVLTSFV